MSALRERIEAIKAGADARPAPPAPSRTIGLFAWSTTRRYDDDTPVGGIVVEVMEHIDEAETGEISESFRTIDPYRTRPSITWHVLAEAEVDRTTVTPADAFTIAGVIRRLCEEVAMRDPHRQRGRGRCEPEHVNLIAFAHRLAGAL